MAMKLRGLRWWMIGLLTLGTVMDYLARSSLGVAAPTVMTDLHISTQQYGWITAAFLVMWLCAVFRGARLRRSDWHGGTLDASAPHARQSAHGRQRRAAGQCVAMHR